MSDDKIDEDGNEEKTGKVTPLASQPMPEKKKKKRKKLKKNRKKKQEVITTTKKKTKKRMRL